MYIFGSFLALPDNISKRERGKNLWICKAVNCLRTNRIRVHTGNRHCLLYCPSPRPRPLRQRPHLVPRHGARVRYSLGTNVNTPFFQVPTLEFGHGAGTRIQGLDLVLGHKSGQRVPV